MINPEQIGKWKGTKGPYSLSGICRAGAIVTMAALQKVPNKIVWPKEAMPDGAKMTAPNYSACPVKTTVNSNWVEHQALFFTPLMQSIAQIQQHISPAKENGSTTGLNPQQGRYLNQPPLWPSATEVLKEGYCKEKINI